MSRSDEEWLAIEALKKSVTDARLLRVLIYVDQESNLERLYPDIYTFAKDYAALTNPPVITALKAARRALDDPAALGLRERAFGAINSAMQVINSKEKR